MRHMLLTNLIVSLSRALLDTLPRQNSEPDLALLAEGGTHLVDTVGQAHCGHGGPGLRLRRLAGRLLLLGRGLGELGAGGERGRGGGLRLGVRGRGLRLDWGGGRGGGGGGGLGEARQRHLVRVLRGAVEGDGPGGEGGGVAALVLDLELPGAGRVLAPAEHRQEGPVVEAGPGAVVRPPGQQLGLGAGGRGQVDGDVAPPGGLHRHVGLDVLQEVDVPVVGDLHLGGPAAAARHAHLADARLDRALDLGPDIAPQLRHLHHAAGVHHAVAEGVAVVPAQAVHPPVSRSQIGDLGPDDKSSHTSSIMS